MNPLDRVVLIYLAKGSPH